MNTWHRLTDKQRTAVISALRASKGDRPAGPDEIALADRIQAEAAPGMHDQAYRDAVADPFGEIRVDPDSRVIPGDGGASVMGWLWVSHEDAEIADDEEEGDA